MAYSNNWDTVRDLAGKMRSSALKFGKKAEFIIETGEVTAEETLRAELVSDSSKFYNNFAQFSAEFPEVVIHDYRQFYDALHCQEPVIWKVLQQGRNCFSEIIPDSVRPDINYDKNATNSNLQTNFKAYKNC